MNETRCCSFIRLETLDGAAFRIEISILEIIMKLTGSNKLSRKFRSPQWNHAGESRFGDERQSDTYLNRLLYDRHSAAEILSISLRTLDYRISSGKIKTHRDGNKVLIPRSELVRYARTDHPDPVRPTANCRAILAKQADSRRSLANDAMSTGDAV